MATDRWWNRRIVISVGNNENEGKTPTEEILKRKRAWKCEYAFTSNWKSKHEFMIILSHGLKNPIVPIKIYSRVLDVRYGWIKRRAKKDIRAISRSKENYKDWRLAPVTGKELQLCLVCQSKRKETTNKKYMARNYSY